MKEKILFMSFSKLFALCSLLLALSSSLFAQEKENSEFKLAIGLYNDGMYDLAAEQFKNFINAYPNTSNGIEARFYLGNTQMKLKRYDEARITFQNFALAYIEHPKAPEAWLNVGDAFLALGNERETASAYERVKVFHPKSQFVPEALLKAGQLYRRIGERENAKKNFRSIIQEYPASSSVLPARLAIGEMYAEEGQTELAEREARRVAESDAPAPVKASALFSIGKLHVMMSLFDDAEATFKSITSNYKKTSAAIAAMFELGKLAITTHDYDAAVEYFKKVSSEDTADDSLQAEAIFETGRAYANQKEYGNAQKSFDKLISKFPKSSLAERTLLEAGRATISNGDNKSALQYAKKLLTINNSQFKGHALLLAADASIGLRLYAEAVRYYTNFIDTHAENPVTPVIMLKLAHLFENKLQDYGKALNIYDQINQRYTQSSQIVDAIVGVARCQENIGDYDGASKTYRDLLSQYPACDQFENIKQKIEFIKHHKMKDRDAGIEKLARLMGEVLTEKSKAELSFKLGAIYFNDLKDYESAAKQFSNAIDGGLSEDNLNDAFYFHARAYHLQSEMNPDLTNNAITDYDAFLKQFPKSKWSEDVAYFNYRLKSQQKNPTETISLAQEFLSNHPKSTQRDKVLFDLARLRRATTKAGAPADALQWLELITKEFPESPLVPNTLLERGNIYLSLKQRDSAAIVWEKAISYPAKDPSTLNAIWNLADLHRQNNDYAEAIVLLKRITVEFFYSSIAEKAISLLPELYIANNEYDQAIQVYSDILDEQRSSPIQKEIDLNLYYHLAAVHEKKGEGQKAIHYYNQYLVADSKGAYANKAFYSLGALARAQGKLENASAYFKQAAALGEIGSTSKDIADLLFQTEQYKEAAKQYFDLAQSTDSVPSKQLYQARGIVATLRLDKLPEAQKLIIDFEKAYPKNRIMKAEFEYEKALVYYRKQDYTTAKKLFENVADDFDDTRFGPWGHYYIGKISEVANKLEEAAKKYETILKKFPQSDVIPRVLLSLGNMHFNAERFEESIRYYQQITKSPENAGDILPYALNNLIEVYESTKMYDEALKTNRDYIERYPNDANIIDKKIKLGMLYIKIGYYDQAVLHFQNLIPEAGSLLEAEIRYNIGEAFYYKGDYQQAILEFLKVPYLVAKQGKVNWTATALYMAGQSYEKISKFDEAIGMYQQVIDRPGIDATFKAAARKEIDRVKSLLKKD
ncbi:MAG: tetratricopeptide repeat protein [Bacteroidota bacterium]|nr:tetratricopeptide repeat protein [Bacteroidota bacterium]